MTRRLRLLAALCFAACRADRPGEPEVIYDAAGLPDCAATYDAYVACDTLAPWYSSVPDGFVEPEWSIFPVRWIGTEEGADFCTNDGAEAEAYVEEHAPDEDGGTHALDTADPRWFDIARFDADGARIDRIRITRCDFLSHLGAAPPGLEADPAFATYARLPPEDEDFFPVMREMVKWRASDLTVQVILSWGEAVTESRHLRTCGVRCGDCEDPFGPWRNVTGVVEATDWVLDVATGNVTFEATPVLETPCSVRF